MPRRPRRQSLNSLICFAYPQPFLCCVIFCPYLYDFCWSPINSLSFLFSCVFHPDSWHPLLLAGFRSHGPPLLRPPAVLRKMSRKNTSMQAMLVDRCCQRSNAPRAPRNSQMAEHRIRRLLSVPPSSLRRCVHLTTNVSVLLMLYRPFFLVLSRGAASRASPF